MRTSARMTAPQGLVALAILIGCRSTTFVGTMGRPDPDAGCGLGGVGCQSYFDCCSQACDRGLCTTLPCLDAGTACGADLDCCSGNCRGGVCDLHRGEPSCGQTSTACAGESSCCDGYDCGATAQCCISGRSSVECRADSECCYGHCDAGVCCSTGNQLCGTDSDCCAGLGCWFGVCIPSCVAGWGCGSGNTCVSGICLISFDYGWCLRDVDCVTDHCDMNHQCACGGLDNPCVTTGDCCFDAEQCVDALCKIMSSEGYCIQDSDCASDHCDLSRHDCLGLSGDICPHGDIDCLSHSCVTQSDGGQFCE